MQEKDEVIILNGDPVDNYEPSMTDYTNVNLEERFKRIFGSCNWRPGSCRETPKF